MNVFAAGNYNSTLTQVETHREAEARLLSLLNRKLTTAEARKSIDFPEFIHALHENDRFWTQVAIDLTSNENRLPDHLKASLISIAGFIISYSAQVRQGLASAQPLVDLNLMIVRGLSQCEEKK